MIERLVRKDLLMNYVGWDFSPGNAIRLLRKEGFVSDQEVVAFDEFWKIRNSVVHGEIQEITDRQSSRILDLLWRLVKVFG